MSKVVTIDFETYYDAKDYSLRNISTAQYIHDPRFQIIGVAASINGGEPEWCSSENPSNVAEFLSNFKLEEEGTITVAHNAMFDGAILEWKLGIKPWKYFCTMMGARPIITPYTGRMNLASVAEYCNVGVKGSEVENVSGMRLSDFDATSLMRYAAYCIQDVDITFKVFAKLFKHFPASEVNLIDLTIKKFTRPTLRLDRKVLKQALDEVVKEKAEVLSAAGLEDNSQLMSNPKFAELLKEFGVEPPMKISPNTGKETYAFAKSDPEFTRLQQHPHPKIKALVKARLMHKSTIEETRLQRFLGLADMVPDQKLAVPLLYYGAHPGRFSGLDKLNLQNLGRKSELRRAISVPLKHKIVAADLSQIEARITACLAGQTDLVELFRYYDNTDAQDRDVYCEFGDKVFARTITKSDEKERFIAKTGVLSLGYQSGAQKFCDSMRSFGMEDFTLALATSVVNTYRTSYPKITSLWWELQECIDCMVTGQGARVGPVEFIVGKILLPNDMFLTYPELTLGPRNAKYKFGNEWRDLYGGKLTENIVQALARIVMTTAELRLAAAGLRAALSVHDELVFVVPENKVDIVVKAVRMALTAKVPWMPELPVNCEIGVGDNYGEAK